MIPYHECGDGGGGIFALLLAIACAMLGRGRSRAGKAWKARRQRTHRVS